MESSIKELFNRKTKLRLRLITSHPFEEESLTSYGLIMKSTNSNKYLVVQRRVSLQFILVIRGRFLYSYLNDYLSNMTNEEKETLKKCILDRNYYEDLMKEMNFKEREWFKLQELKPLLKRGTLFTHADVELAWGWPKGVKNKGESDIQASLREFYEETGIFLSQDDVHIKSKTVIRSTQVSLFVSITELLNVEVPEEITPHIRDNIEICSCRWMTLDELDRHGIPHP